MKFRKGMLAVVAMMTMQGASAGYADEPRPCKNGDGKSAAVAEKCGSRSALETLLSLRGPVHIRVVECEQDLLSARQALVSAIDERDSAQDAAKDALRRVETVANLLRAMCQTLEINGTVYSKEDVATALATLVERYRKSACDARTAEEQVHCRTKELRQVANRVARWQKQERALVEQVAQLKASQAEAESASGIAAASQLVTEVNDMLAQSAQARVALKVQLASQGESNSDAPAPPAEPAAAPPATPNQPSKPTVQPDGLLDEVDRILTEKAAAPAGR